MAQKMETEKDLIKLKTELQNHLEKQLIKDDVWYLVDESWMDLCKNYVGYDNEYWLGYSNPGPINNQALFKDDYSGEINDHMIEELDYVLVPEEAWSMLVKHFKIVQGQEPIARKVVEHGMFIKHCKVEVYFIEFRLAENSDLEEVIKKKFSKSDTLENISNWMRGEFCINEGVETRLWNKYTSNTYEQLARLNNTVQDAGLFSGQFIIIEQKNEDGTWPRQDRTERSLVKKEKALGDVQQFQKFKYETAENETQFVENMKTLYSLGSFSDLVIFCGDKKFLVHKNVLASRSDVFKEMLENDDKKIHGDLEITDTSPITFKIVIDHIYTGKIPNSIDNAAEELFRLATKYNLQFLAKACELSLLEQLTEKNALETLKTLDKHNSSTEAKNDVIKYITLNATNIVDTEEFQQFADKQPKLMIEIVRQFATQKAEEI